MLNSYIQSLDRGLLAYSPIGALKTGTSSEFDVVVTDVGRGPHSTVITKLNGSLVYQQDVPTGGIVGVTAVYCQNLTCEGESSLTQPVLSPGDSATWRWQITAGTPGPAEIILRADTYDQGSQQTLSEEIIPITGNVVSTPQFNQQQRNKKIANVAKSGYALIVTLGSIATAIVAIGVPIGWLIMKKRQRKRADKISTSHTSKRKAVGGEPGATIDSMSEQLPRMNRDPEFLARKRRRIYEPHVEPFTALIERWRREGRRVPYADPDSGGIHARVLFLHEITWPAGVGRARQRPG